MFVNQAEKALAILISIGGFFVTITVVSWGINEPVNAPKLLVMGAVAGGVLFLATKYRARFAYFAKLRVLYLTIAIFLISALTSIFFSESSVAHGFYGTFGRNTGFLAYFCLAILLLGSSLLKSQVSIQTVLNGLFYAGVFNVVYFVLTRFGIELFAWNNSFDRILGTFGNPNFVGSFMGIFIVLCTVRLVDRSTILRWRVILVVLILVSIYEVKLSLAVQGIVITCLGWAIIAFFYIRSRFESKSLVIVYVAFIGMVGALATAGALQKGPLSELIYKTSVSLRGEYWYAGWHMGVTHPLLGVGMDSYGIWYRRMRAASALDLPGAEITSDAAHNVFLDIFASGGFILLISYVLLNALVLLHIWRGLRTFKKFDLVFVSLAATWLCYQAQSIISINQIGLAIWGWILGGLIIGYVHGQTRTDMETAPTTQNGSQAKGRIAVQKQKPVSASLIILGMSIGGVIAGPPVLADSKWHATQIKLDPAQVANNSKVWPLEAIRLLQASTIYTSRKVPTTGLELARYAVEKFPNNFYAWRVLSSTPGITDLEKAKAKAEMLRLDPLNPAFK
jgi:O-antigen ligase